MSPQSGGAGGEGYSSCQGSLDGGFGGGAGGSGWGCSCGAGGGGGYSGGSAASGCCSAKGGGGGSYTIGARSYEAVANNNHGYVQITASYITPLLSIPRNLNYSDVPLPNDMTFELINYNETPTIIDSIKIGSEEGGTDEIPQFQVIGSDSFTIEPDSTHLLTIRYLPDYYNSFYDFSELTAGVWFYNQSEINMPPVYNGISISDNSVLNLSSTPFEHVFSDIPVGTFIEQDITFTNISEMIQEITDILPGYYDYEDSLFVELSEFTIVNETEFELNPGESQIITLRYSPEDVGTDDAFLYSFGPDYIHHIMPISGSGILPTITITPESLDFGNVQVGAYSDQLISITPDISVGEIDIVDINSSSSVFTVVSDTSFSVLPEEVIPITVRFTPMDIE